MDAHGAVETGRCETGGILGMGPGELVDGAVVSCECGRGSVGVVANVVEFDGAIW